MRSSNDGAVTNWQIFEIGGAGQPFPRWAVAQSLKRAMAIALDDVDHLEPGLTLVVWNKTNELMRPGHPMQTQTMALLNEASEGLVFFDRRIGWERLDQP